MNDTGVLIIGAGPTGMVLALWPARLGVPVQIVDKAEQSASTSRALAVQARTLEFYQQLGIAAAVVEHGRQVRSANLWVSGRRAAHAAFADLGRGLSPFPYALIYPQDEHEGMLVDRLTEAGIAVQRRTELISFTQDDESVVATLKGANGEISTCRAAYIAGCDGAHSVVRQSLGIGFPGGLYSHLFYVADVEAGGAVLDGQLHLALDQSDFLVVFPLREAGRARLIGTVRDEVGQARTDLCWEDVSQRVLAWLPV